MASLKVLLIPAGHPWLPNDINHGYLEAFVFLLAGILLLTLLGGVSHTGASTNTGWFALILVLGCIPFGGLLLTLGVAKWLRNRRLGRG